MSIPRTGPYSYIVAPGHRFSGIDRQLHSVDDEPAIVYNDGTKWWYDHDKVSRGGDKPAVVWWNGVQEWWVNNERHRDNGPAVIYPDTPDIHPELRGVEQYWEHGKMIRVKRAA